MWTLRILTDAVKQHVGFLNEIIYINESHTRKLIIKHFNIFNNLSSIYSEIK